MEVEPLHFGRAGTRGGLSGGTSFLVLLVSAFVQITALLIVCFAISLWTFGPIGFQGGYVLSPLFLLFCVYFRSAFVSSSFSLALALTFALHFSKGVIKFDLILRLRLLLLLHL